MNLLFTLIIKTNQLSFNGYFYNSEQNPVVSNDLFKNVLVRFTPQRKYTVEIVIVGLLFEVCVPVDYTSASIFRHKFDIFMMMINGLEMADCFSLKLFRVWKFTNICLDPVVGKKFFSKKRSPGRRLSEFNCSRFSFRNPPQCRRDKIPHNVSFFNDGISSPQRRIIWSINLTLWGVNLKK